MKILESSENYLETILILKRKNGYVRGVDIANYLSFSKASVSVALKSLRENGLISVDEAGDITLLGEGKVIAEKMFERHQFLSVALMKLGVDEDIATKDACKIEHIISPETFEAIKKCVGETYEDKKVRDMF